MLPVEEAIDALDVSTNEIVVNDTISDMSMVNHRAGNLRSGQVNVATKIKTQETRKIEESYLRKRIRTQLEERYRDVNTEGKSDDETIRIVINKAHDDFKIDPRSQIIPSKLCKKNIDSESAVAIDEEQFKIARGRVFNSEVVSDYIEELLNYFDIEPYSEVIIKSSSNNKNDEDDIESVNIKSTKLEPNNLPMFSKWAFKVGLTLKDIETLYSMYPRFAHAYDMCKEMQEYILVTNMLLGLYKSSTSIFVAKNILSWKGDDSSDLMEKFDMNSLMEKVMSNSEGNNFMNNNDNDNNDDDNDKDTDNKNATDGGV